jgi:diguanylate cyclase (GGDEF)-like protein
METYREVDRAYLDDVGQRALAFELARHEARAKSLQIESLNRRNQVLELEQQVAAKDVQTARLSILLLLTVLASAIFWALRTRRMKRHFQNLAQSDSLTSVSSRPYFMDRAVARLEQLQRDDQHAALIVIDLDYFKNVNDQYGHAVGDDVLQRAAFACGILLEPSDLFGRLGGEEFAILSVVSMERAVALAERCRLALHEISFGSEEKPSTLSGSFGVASSEYSGYDLRSLLVHADAALYEAKRKGRNRVISQAPQRGASIPFRAIA